MSVFTLLRFNGDGEQFPPQIGSYCLFTISPRSTVHITVMYCPAMIWSRLDSRISSSEPFLRRLYWTSQAKSCFKLKCSALELSVCLSVCNAATAQYQGQGVIHVYRYIFISFYFKIAAVYYKIMTETADIQNNWSFQMLTLKEERCTKQML